jgi:hypothetical protein
MSNITTNISEIVQGSIIMSGTNSSSITDTANTISCIKGVNVTSSGNGLPSHMSGFYLEAFNCAMSEGPGASEGVDPTHCFRKTDGSSWRIWNTGCGWEIGEMSLPSWAYMHDRLEWQRFARYYTGNCGNGMPDVHRGVMALTTTQFYDGFGNLIPGIQTR